MTKPVAFYDPTKGFYWAKPTKITAPVVVDVEPLALYTQHTWVGLTDGVMCDIAIEHGLMSIDWIDFARAIEAKLRSKNT